MQHIQILPAERVSAPIALPGALPPPPPAVTRVLSRYTRDELAGFIAVAIDLLDLAEPDPDLEANDRGGETLAISDTDDCPVDDDSMDCDLEETDCEDSFVLSGRAIDSGRGPGCTIADPDKGTDDDGEAIDEREPDDDDHEYPAYGVDQDTAPLPPHLANDRALIRPHLQRVRHEACDRIVTRFGDVNYRLRDWGAGQ